MLQTRLTAYRCRDRGRGAALATFDPEWITNRGGGRRRRRRVAVCVDGNANFVIAEPPGVHLRRALSPTGGYHGGPSTARTLALVGGGHPRPGRSVEPSKRGLPPGGLGSDHRAPAGLPCPAVDGRDLLR